MIKHYLPVEEPIQSLPNHYSHLEPKISNTTTTYFRKAKFYQVSFKIKLGLKKSKKEKRKKISYSYDKPSKI